MKQQVTQSEIKASYAGEQFAEEYVERRFEGGLFKLLHDRQVAAVQQVLDEHRPQRVLEVAPGPGRVTRDVRFNGEWVCLEFNEGMLKVGKSASREGITWVQGDAFAISEDGPFDAL